MAKKNNNLKDFFDAMGIDTTGAEDLTSAADKMVGKNGMPDLSDLSKFVGTDIGDNPEDMLKSLAGIIKKMPKVRAMDAKDVKNRTTEDASVIRSIFKGMPGIGEFVDQLTDDEINAGPGALFDIMEKKRKKAKKAGVSEETVKDDRTKAGVELESFLKFATDMIDDMTSFEKEEKIKHSPLSAMVIGLIIEMGGKPQEHIKQLNKIVEQPETLKRRTVKILKKVTRGNPSFLNTYAYLCSDTFDMSNIGAALDKDKALQDSKKVNPGRSDGKTWKPGKAAKKIAKIKKRFQSRKRTGPETIDAMNNLTDSVAGNVLVLLEILAEISKDIPGAK